MEGLSPQGNRLLPDPFLRLLLRQRVFLHDHTLLQKDVRLIGQLGIAQPLQTEIFLPVHVLILLGKMPCELLVDDGERSFVSCIGFFNADIKDLVCDRTAEGEGDQLPPYPYRTACGTDFIPEVEDTCHRAKFLGEFFRLFGIVLRDSPPVLFYGDAFRNHVLGERTVFIVRIGFAEFVAVVAFALQLLPGERRQLLPGVDVIEMVAVGLDEESVGEDGLQDTHHIGADTQHEKRMAQRDGVVTHLPYDGGETLTHGFFPVTFPYRCHIGKVMPGVKTEHEKTVDFGYLGIVKETP